jgi:hypothetical protein
MIIKYKIHKAGTPRIGIGKHGGIAPAGEWWQDTKAMCGTWTDATNATVYATNRGSLPPNGEWVEIYTNED